MSKGNVPASAPRWARDVARRHHAQRRSSAPNLEPPPGAHGINDQGGNMRKRLSRQERYLLASYFLRDAVERREPRTVRFQSPIARALYMVHRKGKWLLLTNVCALAMIWLAAFEPGQSWREPPPPGPLAAEAALLLVLGADLAMPICYEADWSAHALNRWNGVAYVLLVADWLAAVGEASANVPIVRPLRALRPMYFVFVNRATRNTALAVLSTLPALADIFMLCVVWVLASALFCSALFGQARGDAPAAGAGGGGAPLPYGDGYSTLARSLGTLAVLFASAENYPGAQIAAMSTSADVEGRVQNALAEIFFPIFILVGFFVVASVLVAVIFENYKAHHKSTVLHAKALERKSLLAAMVMADWSADGMLNHAEFNLLMRNYNPSLSSREVHGMFRLLDSDSTGSISVREFLSLGDHLVMQVRSRRNASAPPDLCCHQESALLESVAVLVRDPSFERAVNVAIGLNFIAFVVDLALGQPELSAVFDLVDVAFVLLFVAEIALKIVGLGPRAFFESGWHRFDFVTVCAGVVSSALTVVEFSGGAPERGLVSTLSMLRVLRLLRLFRVTRVLRIVSHVRSLRAIGKTFVHMLPMFASILGLVLVVMGVFATIGTEVMYGALPCGESYAFCLSFDKWTSAMWVLFVTVVGNDWPDIMFGTMNGLRALSARRGGRADTSGWGGFFYFGLYFVVVNLLLVNLLTALVIEVYVVEVARAKEELDGQKEADKLLATMASKAASAQGKPGTQPRLAAVRDDSRAVRSPLPPDKMRAPPGDEQRDAAASDKHSDKHVLGADLARARPSGGAAQHAPSLSAATARGRASLYSRLSAFLTDDVRALFVRYDEDGDGSISLTACLSLISELVQKEEAGAQLDRSEGERALRELDPSSLGFVDFADLREWWQRRALRRSFELHDADASGALASTELHALLSHVGVELSEGELLAALAEMDPNEDGKITLDELLRWWRRYDVEAIFQRCGASSGAAGSAIALTISELGAALEEAGVRASKRELFRALRALDLDGSGTLSLSECIPLFELLRSNEQESHSLTVERDGSNWEEELFLRSNRTAARASDRAIAAVEDAVRAELDEITNDPTFKSFDGQLAFRVEAAMGRAVAAFAEWQSDELGYVGELEGGHRLTDIAADVEQAAVAGGRQVRSVLDRAFRRIQRAATCENASTEAALQPRSRAADGVGAGHVGRNDAGADGRGVGRAAAGKASPRRHRV